MLFIEDGNDINMDRMVKGLETPISLMKLGLKTLERKKERKYVRETFVEISGGGC